MQNSNGKQDQRIDDVKARIQSLKRGRRFIDWAEAPDFADGLCELVEDITAMEPEPLEGVRLVAMLFHSSKRVIERCDDSDGCIGSAYSIDAAEAFAHFAAQCEDKQHVLSILLKLLPGDEYSLLDRVLQQALTALGKDVTLQLAASLWKSLESRQDEQAWRSEACQLRTLAKALDDARMFERASLWGHQKLYDHTCLDISRVYLQTGDPDSALGWLERAPRDTRHLAEEFLELQMKIMSALGDDAKAADCAWSLFRSRRTVERLEQLLEQIGPEKREEVVAQAVLEIGGRTALELTDIGFLLTTGMIKEAAGFVVARANQLDGNLYQWLVPIAKDFEKGRQYLAAAIVYRALLDSILARAYAKAYYFGVRYLRKLDKLSAKITDWGRLPDHETYRQTLHEKHKRKTSFWSNYPEWP